MRHALACAASVLLFFIAAPRALSAEGDLRPGATPRATMREFLTACRAGDYTAAAGYLDLRHLPAAERELAGPPLARRFKRLLDRTLWIDLESLSDAKSGDSADGLPAARERVGTIALDGQLVPVELERRPGANRPDWRVASATVVALGPWLERASWVEDRLAPAWTDTRFLEISLWQWIALPLLLVAAVALARLAVLVLSRPMRAAARVWFGDDARFTNATRAPELLLIGALLFRAGSSALALSVPAQEALSRIAGAAAWLGLIWLAVRVTALAGDRLVERLTRASRPGAASLVSLATRFAKAALIAIAALAVLQSYGVNVTGILAGLGVGGLAVALAAQKTVENLFGGVSLVADQPVRVGDFCRFGDRLGTIEAIGLRSTRIRTLDRTLVTVPNGEFSALQLENFTERDRIWMKLVIGLRYETTPDQLRRVLNALRALLRGDPRVDPDPARVRFVAFGAYSLDLEVFAYIRTADFDEFLAIREELLLGMMDTVAASGTSFAFPSQTIYGAPDTGIDALRTRAAELEVKRRPSGATQDVGAG